MAVDLASHLTRHQISHCGPSRPACATNPDSDLMRYSEYIRALAASSVPSVEQWTSCTLSKFLPAAAGGFWSANFADFASRD